MTALEAQRLIQKRLGDVSDTPQAEAYRMLEHLTSLSHTELTLNRQQALTDEQVKTLYAWLERRLKREPLQHILGVAPFYGLELNVTPEVLIPRPETERLVELVLADVADVPSPRFLDVGTGSGAVAFALKAERPDAMVMATDISEAALKVAQANAERLGLEVQFILSDLLDRPEVRRFAQGLNVLVANLPYLPGGDRERVRPEVRRDPEPALYSGGDGLDHFRKLEAQAFGLLEAGSSCWLELDPRNVNEAAKTGARWSEVSLFRDLAERERFLKLTR